jgi:hypothetical protein
MRTAHSRTYKVERIFLQIPRLKGSLRLYKKKREGFP